MSYDSSLVPLQVSYVGIIHFCVDLCCITAGMTPLNMACNRRNSAIAKMFIAANAIVNLADATGSLPLHYIARCGDVHVAQLLLYAGTDCL